MPDTPSKRVAVISPDGQFGTIDEKHADSVIRAGGRVLSKKEVAEREVQERYDALPTASKALGVANTIVGGVTSPLNIGQDPAAPPTIAAFGSGVRSGLTAGLSDVGARKFADAVGGKAAGDEYIRQADQQKEASPVAHTLGEAAGMAGGAALAGAGGAANALPSAGISTLGGAAEGLAARGLASTAAKGALGRAASTAVQFGARGAVEGGAYAGAQYAADQLAHDKEIATDKLFSAIGTGALWGGGGGAVLGGAGSLAASGVRAGAEAARDGLARVMARGGEVAAEVAGKEAGALGEAAGAASKRLANEFAVDALGATKTQARAALEHVSADAVGEYVNRVGIGPAAEKAGMLRGALKVGMAGRADDLLGVIQSDKYGRIATGLSDAIKGTPARFDAKAITQTAEDIYAGMRKDPTKIAGAESFRSRVLLEMEALSNSGKIAADGTMDAAEAFYTRASLAKQAYEVSRTSGAAGDAYKGLLREWDNASIRAIDDAAAQAGKSGVGDEIRHWKREWQLASAAEKMAEGGAERMTRNNTFGIRESIGAAAGLAMGSPIGALATMVGGKLVRERGSAVAAHVMSELAERGTLTKWLQRTDAMISKASAGVLQPPAKGILSGAEKMPASKTLAKTALDRVAEFQANPDATINRAARQAEQIAAHDPEVADALIQRQVKALTFLASKVPQTPDPDPLDPHPTPKMTAGEEATFAKYAWYVDKPERFFREISRGKVTYEGAEVAQELMPRAFTELQERTLEALTNQMAKGKKIPYRQRLILGVLLNEATTPSQRPDHAAFLQKNVDAAPPEEPSPGGQKPRPMPVMKPQTSALDRLEASGPGRR